MVSCEPKVLPRAVLLSSLIPLSRPRCRNWPDSKKHSHPGKLSKQQCRQLATNMNIRSSTKIFSQVLRVSSDLTRRYLFVPFNILSAADRRWRWQHFFAFYLTMTFSPSSYNLGASLVSIGLLWWHGIIAAIIGSAILTVMVVLNSRGAIKYFVGFPVYVRAAGGIRGASLYILVRAIVAIIYFATQTYYGGRITTVFMRGIFGNGYNNIPNQLPASAGITSRDLLSFFIFWMVRSTLSFVARCSRDRC